MVEFAPKQPDEMLEAQRRFERRHRRPASPAAESPVERPRNVEPILSIGDASYFHFRGRAFGVPPLPWKAGQRITDAQARAIGAMATLSSDPTSLPIRADYYKALGQLAPLLWRHCRPVGKLRRFLRFIGLHRNPFANATDRELLELADFFSSRRMRSGVPAPPAMARPRRSTSSTS